jgi:cyclohexyl-isocyanide hydratase
MRKIAGDQIAMTFQIAIEYDPKPPFDCGSPDKVLKEILDKFK